jgi:putative sigma-54 modulation protein
MGLPETDSLIIDLAAPRRTAAHALIIHSQIPSGSVNKKGVAKMQTIVKGRNMEITDTLRSYSEGKLARLDRYMPNITEARIDLSLNNSKSVQDRFVAQITLRAGSGTILRTEERSADMHNSIDQAVDKMGRQINRYKGKHWQSQVRLVEEEIPAEGEPTEVEVVRVKRFQTRPMTVEDAVDQMELLGHDFFAFYDIESNGFSVVYRRRDGGYGLLLPELA